MQLSSMIASLVAFALGALAIYAGMRRFAQFPRSSSSQSKADKPNVTRESLEAQPNDEAYRTLLRRLSAVEIAAEQLGTRCTNIADTNDERFRRLSARIGKVSDPAATAAPTDDDAQLAIFSRPPAPTPGAPIRPNGHRPLIARR